MLISEEDFLLSILSITIFLKRLILPVDWTGAKNLGQIEQWKMVIKGYFTLFRSGASQSDALQDHYLGKIFWEVLLSARNTVFVF